MMPGKRNHDGRLFHAARQSPWGEIRVLCSSKGLREVQWHSRGKAANGRVRPESADAERGSHGSQAGAGAMLARQALAEIGEYLAGHRREFAVPLDLEGTPFQLKVWKALLAIPYGETRSYGEIARAVGRPQAARAVGMANHSNPIPIVVPCHRVIAGDGSLGGYGGGIRRKTRLLRLERASKPRGKFAAISRRVGVNEPSSKISLDKQGDGAAK